MGECVPFLASEATSIHRTRQVVGVSWDDKVSNDEVLNYLPTLLRSDTFKPCLVILDDVWNVKQVLLTHLVFLLSSPSVIRLRCAGAKHSGCCAQRGKGARAHHYEERGHFKEVEGVCTGNEQNSVLLAYNNNDQHD